MKTIIFCMLIFLFCNYCNAQLNVENSTPKPKKQLVYDRSKDLYVKSHDFLHRIGEDYEFYGYEFYYTFINKRIFCISDEAFSGYKYVFEMQTTKIDNPIKACLFYKKKQLPHSIDFFATHLYKPCMTLKKPEKPIIDDMRGEDFDLQVFERGDKKKRGYKLRLYNFGNYEIDNEPMHCTGKFYTIRKVLTENELAKLLRGNPEFVVEAETKNSYGKNKYYESNIYDKLFLTESVKNNVFIASEFGDLLEDDRYSFEPFFLLEDEYGEQFVTRLNSFKERGNYSSETYTSYVIEEHLEYLKEKFIGKLYHIRHYPNPDEKGKIEDIVIRDNVLSVKYVNIETKDIGYRAMEWNSTGNLWVVAWADEIAPEESK